MRIDNGTAAVIVFFMADSSDHRTAKTGLTPSVNISKNGGAFASSGGTVAEISNGFYKYTFTATETNTNGPLAVRITGTAADEWRDIHEVRTLEADKSTLDSLVTTIGTPVNADISADIAATHARIGAPVSATIATDIAAVQTTANTISSNIGTPATDLAADLAVIDGNVDAILDDTGTSGVQISQTIMNGIADSVHRRRMTNTIASSYGDTVTSDVQTCMGLILGALNSYISGTTLYINKPDDTQLGTASIQTDSGAYNLTSVDS